MEVLKNVLIKEVDGRKDGDKVFIVDNLPKSLLYTRAKKLVVDYTNPQQNLVPCFTIKDGRKVETGEMVDEILPGIEVSQTGDEAYVFFTSINESKARLQEIDRYIQNNVPIAERVAQRIPYSSQPGVMTASPRPLSQIPRVLLPEPVSPPSKDVQVNAAASPVLERAKKERKPMSDEQKAAARERMAKARAMKANKASA